MRVILEEFEPTEIRGLFGSLFRILEKAEIIKEYRYWEKMILVAVDGVEHFSSQKVQCPSYGVG